MKLITRIELTREEAIDCLMAIRTQWNNNDGSVLADALADGRTGFNTYSNDELASELKCGESEVLQQLDSELAGDGEVDYEVTGDMTDTECAARKQYRMGDRLDNILAVLEYAKTRVPNTPDDIKAVGLAREALNYINA